VTLNGLGSDFNLPRTGTAFYTHMAKSCSDGEAIPPAAQQERGPSPADGSVRGSGEPEKPDAGGAE